MPQLGAVNYSPILQGSLAAAEGQMRGAEAVARGIASLGQQAAAGIEKYYDRKESNELFNSTTDRVQKILKDNPAFAKRFGVTDINDTKAIQAGILALGGGDKRTASKVTEQLLFQLGAEEESRAREERGRQAMSDALDPVMALANRVITPDQFTSGQGIGSNQFLMQALSAGAPVEAATRIAGQLSEREALDRRLGSEASIARAKLDAEASIARAKLDAEAAAAAAKLRAEQAKANFTPRVTTVNGVRVVETSPGNFQQVNKDGSPTIMEIAVPLPDGRKVNREVMILGTRIVDKESGMDIYPRVDDYGQPLVTGVNPGFVSLFETTPTNPEELPPATGGIKLPSGWSFQK